MRNSIKDVLIYILESWWLMLVVGIITLYFSIIDLLKNYKQYSLYGKSSVIGFIGLGLILITISYIQFNK